MKRFISVLLCLVFAAGLCLSAAADFAGPEKVALAIGGDQISRGRGFLKNFTYLTAGELEAIAASASGESTYRLGLGDSFSEELVYSTYENHGTPVWGFRRVYGFDLRLMAVALGVDTQQNISLSVQSSDGMSKTLPDAFGFSTKRWSFAPDGSVKGEVNPILALYQTESETDVRGGGTYPAAPVLGQDSADRVNNVFGYGQTETDEVTACFWVKYVDRLRFGSESVAVTAVDSAGKKSTAAISAIAAKGVWRGEFGSVKAEGIPLDRLLSSMGVSVGEGQCVMALSDKGTALYIREPASVLAAWQASDNGSAVKNSTPLRLYCEDGHQLPGLVSLSVVEDTGRTVGITRDCVLRLPEAVRERLYIG